MESKQFNKIVEDRCDKIKSILANKAQEYAKGCRLHNFKVAGRIANTSPELALKGMMMKHLVSVFDLIDDAEKGIAPTEYLIQEKLGDSVNYLILLEALLTERLENSIKVDEKKLQAQLYADLCAALVKLHRELKYKGGDAAQRAQFLIDTNVGKFELTTVDGEPNIKGIINYLLTKERMFLITKAE